MRVCIVCVFLRLDGTFFFFSCTASRALVLGYDLSCWLFDGLMDGLIDWLIWLSALSFACSLLACSFFSLVLLAWFIEWFDGLIGRLCEHVARLLAHLLSWLIINNCLTDEFVTRLFGWVLFHTFFRFALRKKNAAPGKSFLTDWRFDERLFGWWIGWCMHASRSDHVYNVPFLNKTLSSFIFSQLSPVSSFLFSYVF